MSATLSYGGAGIAPEYRSLRFGDLYLGAWVDVCHVAEEKWERACVVGLRADFDGLRPWRPSLSGGVEVVLSSQGANGEAYFHRLSANGPAGNPDDAFVSGLRWARDDPMETQ